MCVRLARSYTITNFNSSCFFCFVFPYWFINTTNHAFSGKKETASRIFKKALPLRLIPHGLKTLCKWQNDYHASPKKIHHHVQRFIPFWSLDNVRKRLSLRPRLQLLIFGWIRANKINEWIRKSLLMKRGHNISHVSHYFNQEPRSSIAIGLNKMKPIT